MEEELNKMYATIAYTNKTINEHLREIHAGDKKIKELSEMLKHITKPPNK
jgi:hypothetical protein